MPLFSPSPAVRDLYARSIDKDIDKFPRVVTAHFSNIFSSEDAFNEIPVLNLQHPPGSFVDGSLVAFRAMIQDTSFSPELYLARKANGDCGGWGSNDADVDRVEYKDLRECSVFWAVSIPGMSPWCTGGTSSNDTPDIILGQSHKYPVPNAPHVGVQLKVYDELLSQPIRTTDLLTYVGILSTEPLHSIIETAEPLNVPTLHVLFSRPLLKTIVPRVFPDPSILPTIKTIRKELIQWIAEEALAGDTVSAEWILLTASARVWSRNPPILPLSTTISGFPSPGGDLSLTPVLHHVLSLIFPIVTTLPLSLDALNNTSACPESKEEDLHSGWLQHPKGSILVLTEGAVTEGGILAKGMMNIRSVQEMIKSQTLDYIFPYSGYQFETDVTFFVLSEGIQSTFFKTDINISLRPVLPGQSTKSALYKSESEINVPSDEKLAEFRKLVGGSKIGHVAIADSASKHIEDGFVKERSSSSKNPKEAGFTPDDLIQCMLVARMVALSSHEVEVTIDSWEHAKKLFKYRH